MAFEIGTAANNEDLIDRVIRFVCGHGTVGTVTLTGTGNGTLALGGTYPSAGTFPTTITEDWTITCTTAPSTFSVVGSVSGAQADATAGVAYANSFVAFTITAGATAFVSGDAFTFTTTQGDMKAAGDEWEYLGRASGQTTGGWVRGRGLTGSESIYVGMGAANFVSVDAYNINIAGSLGFNPSFSFIEQVGKSPQAVSCFWNTSTPYWIVANGQRLVVVGKVSTTYHAFYAGKILPYATPSQYGYPVYIGCETSAVTTRWSNNDGAFRHFTDPGVSSSCHLCFPDGSWQAFSNFSQSQFNTENPSTAGRSIWPYMGDGSTATTVSTTLQTLRENIDGSYTLMPLILSSTLPSRQVLGEIDGCYYVSGSNNAAENIITIDGQDYLVVQNIFRTSRWHYWALKLA
jgi:hypothetical protein